MPVSFNEKTGEAFFLSPEGKWTPTKKSINPQTKEMFILDGQEWKPVKAQSRGILGYIDDAVRSIASGVTLGFADEIAAKAGEMTGGGTYEENVARERARDAQIPPAIAIPGEIGGAVLGAVAAAPVAAVGAATRAGQAISRLPQTVKYAGLGAGGGAGFGAGTAEEGERLEGAATGALTGGATGAAAPFVVRGGVGAYRGVRNALSSQANVADDLGRAILRDADDPASLMARRNDLAIERPGTATLADVGGENVRGLVERVAQTPGAGRTQVVPALTQRQQAQAARIASDLRSLTGTRRSAVQAVDETMAERAGAASPLYRQAYSEGDVALWSPELERITGSPSFMRAMRGAVNTWKDQAIADGFGAMNPGALVENGIIRFSGNRSVPAFPNLQFWDYTKRILDDQVRTAIRNGQNQKAQALTRITQQFRSELDRLAPGTYREARNAWAGRSAYLDAVEEGRNILSRNVSAEEFANNWRLISESEREAHRIGAISHIVSRMGNDTAEIADFTKYVRAPEVRAKIATLMPTPESAAQWTRRLDFEIGSSKLTKMALGNSATARRLAMKEEADNIAADLIWDVMSGGGASSRNFLINIITRGHGKVRDTLRSRADALLADVLTNPNAAQNLTQTLNRSIGSRRPSELTNAAATMGATEFTASP